MVEKTETETKPKEDAPSSTNPASAPSTQPAPAPEATKAAAPGASSNGEKKEARDAIYEDLLRRQKATEEALEELREERTRRQEEKARLGRMFKPGFKVKS